MKGSARFSLKRLCAMLCVVLALGYAGASAANAVNRIQHQLGGSHEHMLLSEVSVDTADHHDHDDHDDNAGSDDRDGGTQPEHQPGTGHHHHGDVGSGLPAFGPGAAHGLDPGSDSHSLKPDRRARALASYGPERPPKRLTTSV